MAENVMRNYLIKSSFHIILIVRSPVLPTTIHWHKCDEKQNSNSNPLPFNVAISFFWIGTHFAFPLKHIYENIAR